MNYTVNYKTLCASADPALCSTARSILAILKSHIHPKKHVAFPTQSYIAKILGISTRWVRECLKQLRELGYITQIYRTAGRVVAWSVSLTRKWANCVAPVLAMRPFARAEKKRPAEPVKSTIQSEVLFLQSKPLRGKTLDKKGKTLPPCVPIASSQESQDDSWDKEEKKKQLMQKLELKTRNQENDPEYLTPSQEEDLPIDQLMTHIDRRNASLKRLISDYVNRFGGLGRWHAEFDIDTEMGIEMLRNALKEGRKISA